MSRNENRVHADQILRLYANGHVGIVGSFINAFIVTGVLIRVADRTALVVWLVSVLLISLFRALHLRRFRRASPTNEQIVTTWRCRFVRWTFISGLSWGSVALFAAQVPNTLYPSFIAFVIGGMVAASMAVYSSYFPTFAAFSIPATLPIGGVFIAGLDQPHVAMGTMTLLFLGLMLFSSLRINRLMLTRMGLEEVNAALIDKLMSEIEDRKAAQAKLERSKAEVEATVEKRTRELGELNRQLQQAKKMEAIGLLAGGVAHDLNNILSGIVSYPELLLMELSPDSPLYEPIADIHKAGKRAADVVQDLLSLSRRGMMSKEAVDLNHLIATHLASRELALLIDRHPGVRVETDLDSELLHLEGSPIHLKTMLTNLIHNAVDAMPAGGTISIRTRNVYLETPSSPRLGEPEGEVLVLSVRDDGIGMTKEVIERIFEPFFTKKKLGRSGSGLGMALVWGTVVDHGGAISVDSTEGEGTTFEIRFPATRKKVPDKPSRPHLDKYLGRQERILVIDDVAEQRRIGVKILSKLRYRAIAVESGEAALEYLESNPVDLLVLDMVMEPGMDGLDTYRRIAKKHPDIRAIIVSGYSETERVKQAQALGVGAYISKPYTVENLGVAVREALDAKTRDPKELPSTSPSRV